MENKPEELKKVEESIKAPKRRQILIETDGKEIDLVKAEVAGPIELIAILQMLVEFVRAKLVTSKKQEEKKGE